MIPAYGADPNRYQFIPRVLIFVTHENKVLLIRRSMQKKLWPGRYNAPGGHVELGEDPYEAGVRELVEETGIQVETMQLRGLIIAETGLSGSGILVFVFRAHASETALRTSDEGQPVWIDRSDITHLDLLADLPQLIELTLDQPDFFYLYKIPGEDGSEQISVRLIPHDW